MAAFDTILLDEENTLLMDTEISGDSVTTKGIQTRLVIESDGIDYSFDGVFDEDTKQVSIKMPILANTLASGEYKARLEVILADSRYFKPIESTINCIMPTRINAAIKNQTPYKEESIDPVEINVKKVEAEPEVKEEAVETEDDQIEIESKEQLEAYIEELRTEVKLAKDGDFEVKDSLDFEVKMEDTEQGIISGVASKFGNVDSHSDMVHKGAYSRTLNSGRQVLMFYQHNKNEVVGVWDELYETEEGLMAKGRLAMDTVKGKEIASLIRMGAISGLSVGYTVKQSNIDRQAGVKNLTELKLYEISIVSIPSNDETHITSIKSAPDESIDNELRDLLDIYK